MIVLDTNVVSELMRPEPAPAVRAWVLAQGRLDLYTTTVTVAEILYGVERLPDGKRKELLRSTAGEVFGAFQERLLPFDRRAAVHYAAVVDERDRFGRPINGFDAQIAAICRSNVATLATRNAKDFEGTGVPVLDPWADRLSSRAVKRG